MIPASLFDYQWYPRVIEHLTTVTFSNFFRPKLSKIVKHFLVFLFFNLKHKGKKLTFWMILDGKN